MGAMLFPAGTCKGLAPMGRSYNPLPVELIP